MRVFIFREASPMPSTFFAASSSSSSQPATSSVTQFMIDYVSVTGALESLQDYVRRETNYDLAFCTAWQFLFDDKHRKNYNESSNQPLFLVKLLDDLQAKAMGHLPHHHEIDLGYGQTGIQPIQGRVSFAYNYYGLVKDWSADEAGIQELVSDILTGKKGDFNELVIHSDTPGKGPHVLKNDGLYIETHSSLKKLPLSTREIMDFILKEFRKGPSKSGSDRMNLYVIHGGKRTERELMILSQYCEEIKSAETPDQKIHVIGNTMRNLMQLHLYYDGNGRSMVMLANWLLYTNGLPLFYPDNMCIFDANSLKKIHQLITDGQTRFRHLFHDEPRLTASLTAWRETVMALNELINAQPLIKKELDVLKISFKNRDFNLLLRQSAANPRIIDLLRFLLRQKDALNIDVFAKGKSGKDVFDVANERNNQDAILALEPYQSGRHDHASEERVSSGMSS